MNVISFRAVVSIDGVETISNPITLNIAANPDKRTIKKKDKEELKNIFLRNHYSIKVSVSIKS